MLAALLVACALMQVRAGTLTGSFSPITSGSNVNLTALGKLDWVQWGLGGDYAVNRKASVSRISSFTLISQNFPGNPLSFSSPYWLEDTASSCSWQDGSPVVTITNNHTRVMAYSYPVAGGSGFRITVPAETTTNILSVFVGTLEARGDFRATLTGQLMYSHSPPATNVNGVYTITFAANAPGQTLTIEWTLPFMASNGYVTLQAAALTAPDANNPPFALLTHPANDATFGTPADLVLEAIAEDFDGTVTNVAFFANSNLLGQSATSPYTFAWNNAPLGYQRLTAVAMDDRGGNRSSMPVEIFVHGTNGSQTGAIAAPASTVDLTTEGTTDWVHWGLETNNSVNRKASVPAQISNFTRLGTSAIARYADNFTAYSWSDGTPTSATAGTRTGVFLTNLSSGFQLTLPADTTSRILRLYVGAYAARGRLLAYLSDFSAKPYIDSSVFDVSWNNEYAVYTIVYSAASVGQQLIVSFSSVELLDWVWGNVTLQAATLQGETVSVGRLTVTPAGDLSSSGSVGGPFSPTSIIYTLTNSGSAPLSWMANQTVNWVSLSATGGELSTGASTNVTVSLNSAAESLAAGNYSDSVSFVNTTTGNGNTSRTVSLTVTSAGQLAVTPAEDLNASGTVGGPFSPSSIIYTLTNSSGTTLNWTASNSQNWVSLSATDGSLPPETSTTVAASINASAENLTAGSYTDSISFVNTTTGNGNTIRSVNLTVNSTDLPPLYITNAATHGNDFVLSFNTQTGRDYTVEYADSLPPPAWTSLVTLPGNGALVTVTNHEVGSAQRYYRVLSQ